MNPLGVTAPLTSKGSQEVRSVGAVQGMGAKTALHRPWRRRRLNASEQRGGKPLTPRGHFQFKAELGKKERAPIFIGALWLPNGHGGRSAPGGRSSEPSVAQASALRKRTAKRKDANAKRAFSVQSRVGQKKKEHLFS